MKGSGEKCLEIRGLNVSYSSDHGQKARALQDVDLEIRPGEILGILGESGCGKSTLANAVMQLLPAHADCASGQILFRDQDLLRFSESDLCKIRGQKISLVPQDPVLSLNPVITVGSQISEVLRAHLSLTAKERQQFTRNLLQTIGFDRPDEIYDAYPHQLSGGQCQRIVIAQAVSCQPTLLIVDEPTSSLDAALRSEIIALLSAIRRNHGTAILAISHDPALFIGFADRVAVMYSGRIVEAGTCEEIFGQPLHPYTQALVRIWKSARGSRFNGNDRFDAIAGEPPKPSLPAPGCAFEPRCSERMNTCVETCPQPIALEPDRSVSCLKYAE